MNITNEIISCQQKAFACELQLRKIYQQHCLQFDENKNPNIQCFIDYFKNECIEYINDTLFYILAIQNPSIQDNIELIQLHLYRCTSNIKEIENILTYISSMISTIEEMETKIKQFLSNENIKEKYQSELQNIIILFEKITNTISFDKFHSLSQQINYFFLYIDS
jgi:hypothetical protein